MSESAALCRLPDSAAVAGTTTDESALFSALFCPAVVVNAGALAVVVCQFIDSYSVFNAGH